MVRRKSGVDGVEDLQALFGELERVPQTAASQAARAGGSIARRAARKNAPEDDGMLKRGIILKREKNRTKGKATYQVTIDRALNDHFVKVSKDGKRSYYPASQEYGFLTVNGQYVPGYRYMRRAIDDNTSEIEKKMLEVTGKAVDKVLARKRGR